MFTFDKSAERALGESELRLDQSSVAATGRIGAFRRAAVALAIGGTLLVAGLHAGLALAASPYGTEYGVVPSDSVPGGQVETLTNNKTGEVADDSGLSMTAGTQMIQWPSNGGYNQNWVFVPSTGANAGYDEIQNRQSGLCLDVSGASTGQDAPVIQWTCSGNANQQWMVEPTVDSGVDLIQNENSGGYLAVAGGDNDGTTVQGAGLVQDVDNINYTDTWDLSSTTYSILTDFELGQANVAGTQDETNWACVSGYHFRMASAGSFDSATNKWTALPQAYMNQPAQNSAVPGNDVVSTQQGPDGGLALAPGNNPLSESWTNATVTTDPGDYDSDPNPSAASSGQGVVQIDYYYSGAFQEQDLNEQVHLYCDPNS